MRLRGIIFDMDGTLVDSFRAYQVAFNEGVGRVGLPPTTIEALKERLSEGMNLEQIIVDLYPGHDDADFLSACRQEILATFPRVTEEAMPLLPHTREVLEALRARGLKLGVATGRTQPSAEVRHTLDRLGIGHYFGAVVTTADVQDRKPAPDAVYECARQLGVLAEECLVVGDSLADVGAGRAAGAAVAAVLTGVSSANRLAGQPPDAVLADLRELMAVIDCRSELSPAS